MAFDFNAAREIVEAAKKRGMIRAHGEEAPAPEPKKKAEPGGAVLPDWLQASILEPEPPKGFSPEGDR
jgi:hypothetical protein